MKNLNKSKLSRKRSWQSKTRFITLARIDPKQLAWLKENKDTKTIAGFLDKVINYYKQHNH